MPLPDRSRARPRRPPPPAPLYLRLKILGVVVGGVLRVHLLFPHFAHEAGREPAVQGRGYFGVSKSRSLLPLPFRRWRLPLLHLPARTRRPPPPPPPPPPSPPPPASAPRQRERHCRAQRAPRTGRSQGVASRSPSAPGLPRAGAPAALRCGEQAQRGREVINTSGKCCGGGGGGGCARCQAASGVGAPDWERGEGLACRGRGGRAGGGGAWEPRSRDRLEVRADF